MGKIHGVIGPWGPVAEVQISRPAGEVRPEEIEVVLHDFPTTRVKVLFDTGSAATLIHVGVAEILGLTPEDHGVPVIGIHTSERWCDVYNVDLLFEKGRTLLWRFRDAPVCGSELRVFG